MASEDNIYIQVKAKNFGPFTEKELSEHLATGQIPFAAWVYRGGEWKLLAEIQEFRKQHPEYTEMPKSAPSSAKSKDISELASHVSVDTETGIAISAEQVWFLIRNKKKYGPYGAAEIISQLQKKEIEATSFVWRPGFPTWRRMSQTREFSRENIKNLSKESSGVDVIVKRKHKRQPYEVDVVAHDNTRAIEGKTMMIGEGGLYLSTPKPSHRVGSRLKLHFREGNTPAFNAVAEVVSVVKEGEAPGYCMKFVAISDADRRRIAKLVSAKS